jgi:mitochondrial fission protein ELM1
MISEAVCTSKSVYTIGVQNSNPDKNYRTILDKFVKHNFITRIHLETFEIKDKKVDNISSIKRILNNEIRIILGK